MKDVWNCKDCGIPMAYAGAGESPDPAGSPTVLPTEDTSRFWVRCPNCAMSVLQDTRALREMLESERRAKSPTAGPLERTLRAWGIPYTPSKR